MQNQHKSSRSRLKVKGVTSRLRLTWPQAKELVLQSPFKDIQGTEDTSRNNYLYKLLTADVGNALVLKHSTSYFTVAWTHVNKDQSTENCKLLWRKGEHKDNERTKNLILEFIHNKTFGEFQGKSKKFIGKKWKKHFSKEFDSSTSETQRKGRIKLKLTSGLDSHEGTLALKRASGAYNVWLNHIYVGLVIQVVAKHIWRYPELYFALGPVNTTELNDIYSSKQIDSNRKAKKSISF